VGRTETTICTERGRLAEEYRACVDRFRVLYPLSKTSSALNLIELTKSVRKTASPRRKRGLRWIGIAMNIGVRCGPESD
jgi:hypothetical protein